MTEQLDLTDEEKQELIALLKRTLEYARFRECPEFCVRRAVSDGFEPSAR